jgi:hypothetical protein
MGPNCPNQRRGNGACNYQENGVATFRKNRLQKTIALFIKIDSIVLSFIEEIQSGRLNEADI